MKVELNMNDEVTIYPNQKGWDKIDELIKDHHKRLPFAAIDKIIESYKTEDGGYRDTLWCIIQDLHSMFYNGQQYFKNTTITL